MNTEFKNQLLLEKKKDLFWAEVKIAWYKKEVKTPKHHGKEEAIENLDIWTQRKKLLKDQLKLLKEMFEVYGK